MESEGRSVPGEHESQAASGDGDWYPLSRRKAVALVVMLVAIAVLTLALLVQALQWPA